MVAQLLNCARDCGRKDGFAEGLYFAEQKVHHGEFALAHVNCADRYAFKQKEYDSLSFPILHTLNLLSRREDGIAALRNAFEAAEERAKEGAIDKPMPPSDEGI